MTEKTFRLTNVRSARRIAQRPVRTCTFQRARRAFTLVEMVVVIGIIVLLAGLVITVMPAVLGSADVGKVENTMKLLDSAVEEYRASSDRDLTWGVDQTNPTLKWDIQADSSAAEQLMQLLVLLERHPASRDILSHISSDILVRDPDEQATYPLKAVDPWGTALAMVHPGRTPDPYFGATGVLTPNIDPDGTVRVDSTLTGVMSISAGYAHEAIFGPCDNRRIRFVSAGPDRNFGDLSAEHEDDEHKAAHDNVVSYAASDTHED